MKVLLVDPPHLFLQGKGYARQIHPLGLGYVGASLAQEHDVRLLQPDQRAYSGDDPWGEIEAAIRAEAPDVLGLSVLTANRAAAARLATMAKEIDPAMTVVLGGVHPTLLPEDTLRDVPDADYVVRGEGEITALELLRALPDGDLYAIAGLAWRKDDGSVVLSEPRPPNRQLDKLPFPLRENLVWPDDIQPAFYQALMTIRGCPYKCLYCAIPMFNERSIRTRSPDNVADEIQVMVDQYGATYLFFHDPVYTVNRKRTLALCAELKRRGLALPHCIQTRPENVDAELLDAMKDAGLHTVFFGIESGSPQTLARMNRRMSPDRIRESVALASERGIRLGGFFMVGLPWEDEPEMRVTQDFARSLDLDMLVLSSASPFPGTELWDMVADPQLPDSIDFRTPQVNLTDMADDQYGAVFAEIRDSFDTYNRARVMRRHQAGIGSL